MKKAIVTGASGFVGRALVGELLARGVEVSAVVRNPAKMEELQREYRGGHSMLSPAIWKIFFL